VSFLTQHPHSLHRFSSFFLPDVDKIFAHCKPNCTEMTEIELYTDSTTCFQQGDTVVKEILNKMLLLLRTRFKSLTAPIDSTSNFEGRNDEYDEAYSPRQPLLPCEASRPPRWGKVGPTGTQRNKML
jgi:hypothetical protein